MSYDAKDAKTNAPRRSSLGYLKPYVGPMALGTLMLLLTNVFYLGIPEALGAGRRYGVEVVPGVEIPLEFESFTLDMLGYFLCGVPSEEFRAQLEKLRHSRDERNIRILQILGELGYPLQPSELARVAGGEAVTRKMSGMRKAIARNLDSASAEKILEVLRKIHDEGQMTIIVVTHDSRVAAQAERILHMLDGRITGTPPAELRTEKP